MHEQLARCLPMPAKSPQCLYCVVTLAFPNTARVDGNVDATLKTWLAWVDRPRSEPLDPSSWIGSEAMDRRSVFLGRRGGKGTETNAPAAHGR